jgi:hypothetical protein
VAPRLAPALVNLRNRDGIQWVISLAFSGRDAPVAEDSLSKGSVFMFIAAAAPSKRSLGAMTGLAQTVVAIQRTVAPVGAVSLIAFSLANGVLGGNFCYVVLLAVVSVGLCVAAQLPRHMWMHGGSKLTSGWRACTTVP